VENVVVLGMGGSGIAGDVLVATAAPFMPVPVTVVKGYVPPDYVGTGSLVFAMSFSGNTEETLEAATAAFEAGASLIVVAGGGALVSLAREWDVPVIPVAEGIPQPRAALGAMAIPPLVLLEEIGLFPGAVQWVDQAVDQLRIRRDELVRPGSRAEELARRIGRTIPLVHSSGDLGAAAALRWKAQINENAKCPAFFNVYPELCHNEVAGWGQHGDATRQLISLVNLRHDAEHPQVSRRFDLVAEVLREVVADVIEVRASGEGDLAQLLDLALIGDFVSLHLAGNEGIDPGPIPVLDEIKVQLEQGAG
jgi:glucose/mannose-6-phosphate isomerase